DEEFTELTRYWRQFSYFGPMVFPYPSVMQNIERSADAVSYWDKVVGPKFRINHIIVPEIAHDAKLAEVSGRDRMSKN
ncbi:hypothetical protein CRM22_006554, partial [Opisthorchis felineus]